MSATDCGLCSHPAHSIRECSAVNDHGQCVCWWYMPAAEYAARCDPHAPGSKTSPTRMEKAA